MAFRPHATVDEMALFIVAVLTLILQGCSAADQPRQYELEGQILAIRVQEKEVLIKHGDIKGFMPGMTMPFKVKDAELLEGITVGDLVKASLAVAPQEAWIATLEKTGSAPITEPASIPAASFVTPVQPGDVAPETTLTDHAGAPLSLTSWGGLAVAVTFIYLRCPLPEFCPLLDRRFARAQQLIEQDETLRDRARLLSVSFDPDADTPERLQAHADKVQADAAIWRFATAPRATIDRFAAQFGVNVIREEDATITHNMRTTVIGPDRRVVSVYHGSDWTATQIVDDMKRALAR